MNQRTFSVRRSTALAALGVTTLALAGVAVGLIVSGTYPQTKVSTTTTKTAGETTVNGCVAWAAQEETYNGSGGMSSDPTAQKIIAQSAGTNFSHDLAIWLADSGNQALAEADKVNADCTAAGVPVAISESSTTPSSPPEFSASPTWSARAATINGCRALSIWASENNTSSLNNFPPSSQIKSILVQSAGTSFSYDLEGWTVGNPDASTINNDCIIVGVPMSLSS